LVDAIPPKFSINQPLILSGFFIPIFKHENKKETCTDLIK